MASTSISILTELQHLTIASIPYSGPSSRHHGEHRSRPLDKRCTDLMHIFSPKTPRIPTFTSPNRASLISSKYSNSHLKQLTPANFSLKEFNRPPHLPNELIYVPPQHQPPNPEDEDDVVPHQHAAFGITRATQSKREPAWRDLGLDELVRKGPKKEGEGVKGFGGSKLPR